MATRPKAKTAQICRCIRGCYPTFKTMLKWEKPDNPYGGSDYFNLDDIYKEVKPLLERDLEGASLYWKPVETGSARGVTINGQLLFFVTGIAKVKWLNMRLALLLAKTKVRLRSQLVRLAASQKPTLKRHCVICLWLAVNWTVIEDPEEQGKGSLSDWPSQKALHPTPEMLEE